MKEFGEIVVSLLILALTIFIGFCLGDSFGTSQRNNFKKEAIEANVAYYTIDSKTGISSFNWITNTNTNK